MKKKVLVTGAGGFIGSHLVERLVKEGYSVRCLVRKKNEFLERLPVEMMIGDITKREDAKKSVLGMDMVFHFAAAVDAKVKDPKVFYNVNVLGTRNMIEESINAKVKKFIHCSSVGVFGIIDKLGPVDETFPYAPASPYEETKTESEKIVLENKDKIDIVVVRPAAMVYGERDFSAVYSLFKVIKEKKFMIIGSGKNIIHSIYIENLIDGVLLSAKDDNAVGNVYILADDYKPNFDVFTKNIAKALDVKIISFHMPKILAYTMASLFDVVTRFTGKDMPLSTRRVRFMTQNKVYSIDKVKKELGFKSKTGLFEGIKKTAEWYIKNRYL